jgi:hypothetical protein
LGSGPLSLDKGAKAKAEVIVNGKRIYSLDSYQWRVSQLNNLQEGINEIKIRSVQGCIVPRKDNRCLSFTVQNIELFSLEDSSLEGRLWPYRFIETGEGQYWMEKNSAIRIFTSSSTPSFITFQMQSVSDKPVMVSILEKDKEVDRRILFGEESQRVGLLTYQQGENIFYFVSDDCEEKTIEGEKRCIVAQIKDLKIEFLE